MRPPAGLADRGGPAGGLHRPGTTGRTNRAVVGTGGSVGPHFAGHRYRRGVTENAAPAPGHGLRHTILGLLAGSGAHLIPILAGLIAAPFIRRHPGEGFQDLAAWLTVVLLAEALVAIAVIVIGIVQIVRGRTLFGGTMIATWLVLAVAAVLWARG
jgi:hypothetical protein